MALIVNVPVEAGAEIGALRRRPEIWLNTDPDRAGLLPGLDRLQLGLELGHALVAGLEVLGQAAEDHRLHIR